MIKYILEVLQNGSFYIATYELNVKKPRFSTLLSLHELVNSEVIQALRSQFKKNMILVEQNGNQNREK